MDYSITKHLDVYQKILIKYDIFSNTPSIWRDCFHYPAMNEVHLCELREKYHLDKFIGNNVLETAINIMRWVNEIMLFSEYGEYKGNNIALDIIQFSRSNRKILNCAMHSIVLTEALLSLNITSRSIQCLPLDPIDDDSHFINIAYIPYLKKWVALDPSFSTYFTDSENNFLNLAELRNSYIENRLPNINRFTRFVESKGFNMDWYIAYLAKNLFRFSSTQLATYNRQNNIIYFLEPAGYRQDNLEIEIKSNLNRYIGDTAFFWGEPCDE